MQKSEEGLRVNLKGIKMWLSGLTLMLWAVAPTGGPRARVWLDYSVGDSSCYTQSVFEGAVSARLGYDPFVKTQAQTRVFHVTVKSGHGRTATIREEASAGQRTFQGSASDCRPLMEQLALALAMAVDPQRAMSPTSPPTLAPTPLPALAPGAPLSESTFYASTELSGTVGSVPVVNPSLGLGGAFTRGNLWGSMKLVADLPIAQSALNGRVSARRLYLAPTLCNAWNGAALCGGVHAGTLNVLGENYANSRSHWSFYGAATLRAYARVGNLSWARFLVYAEGVVPFETAVAYVGNQKVWSSLPVGFSLGVESWFPLGGSRTP